MNTCALVWSLLIILLAAAMGIGATIATGTSPLLGLDLKGGVSVVEQPQGKVDAGILQEAVNIIDRRVNGLGVSNSDVTRQGSDIVIELPGAKNDTQVLKIVGETAQLFFRPVDCLVAPYIKPTRATSTTSPTGTTTTTARGATTSTTKKGTSGSTTPARAKAATTTRAAVGAGVRTIDARLASVAFPLAAGTTTSTSAKGTTTATSKAGATTTTNPGATTTTKPGATTATSVASTTTTTSPAANLCNLSVAQQEQFPTTPPSKDFRNTTVVLPYYVPNAGYRYVLDPAEMTGSIVKSSNAALNSQTDEWEVDLTFTGAGSTQFDNFATRHYQCYVEDTSNPPDCALQAIELDGTVESAPAIEASAFHGAATISGSTQNPFTQQQASDLALALRYGSLPVRFVPQSIENVSPTIGTDSLKAGALAGAVAVVVVLLYLIIYYRALGLVVVIGICMSGALLYSITTLLSETSGLALTLSGVIGLIVSVGVTADSCVVYFERLKEEIRSGRTVRTSVEKGFGRAFRTILAADFSSFIAAMILYILTVGDVRGFAFFLGLATLLNVVTTYFFTRPLVILIGRRSALTEAGFLGVSRGLGARAFTTP